MRQTKTNQTNESSKALPIRVSFCAKTATDLSLEEVHKQIKALKEVKTNFLQLCHKSFNWRNLLKQ